MNIIFSLLNQMIGFLYSVVGDWGTAIVIATILIRICLLPVSFKQKKSIQSQQELSQKIEEVKVKYKSDKEKMESEMSKLSAESAKNTFGCLVTLLQLPVMYSLYTVFSGMTIHVGSVIVPWVRNLNLPDAYFIIPVLAVLVQLAPNIFNVYGNIKSVKKNGMPVVQMIITGAFSLIFLAKAPVTIGIYWVTSSLFSLLEQLAFNKLVLADKR